VLAGGATVAPPDRPGRHSDGGKMNDTSDLATLVEELHTLESETFEVRDYADSSDLLLALPPYLCSVCSSTSSTCA
jgi:hypothetical protein